MAELIRIIDRIIEEHKILLNQTGKFEKITNDSGAMMALTESKEVFVPGRLNQSQNLKDFEDLHNTINRGLIAHFSLEETLLLDAILEFGDHDIISRYNKLLSEHANFKKSLNELKTDIGELINGQLSRALWEPKANIMRAFVTRMNKDLEQHARSEKQLLEDLRNEFLKAPKS